MATITKRGNSYKITVSCGYDASGKQVRRHMTWTPPEGMAKTKIEKELQRQAVLFEDECAGLGISSAEKFSLICDKYLNHVECNNLLAPKTLHFMKHLKTRVYASLGHIRIDRLSAIQIQAFIDNLAEDGVNHHTGKGLSPKTQKHYLTFISDVCNYALRLRMIKDNPCRHVEVSARRKNEPEFYTLDEIRQVLDMLKSAPVKYSAYMKLAIFGGFRGCEIRGLNWDDIDFDNQVVSIRRNQTYVPGSGIVEGTTKTSGSVRSLILDEDVFSDLRAWKVAQAEQRIAFGDQWLAGERVFSSAYGNPISDNTVPLWLRKQCDAIGITYRGLHAFRHSNATLMINSGVDIKTVSSALGHSQASTTLNIYTHAVSRAQAVASTALSSLIHSENTKKAKTNTK